MTTANLVPDDRIAISVETQNTDGVWVAAFGMLPKRTSIANGPAFETAIRNHLRSYCWGHDGRPIRARDEISGEILMEIGQ